ncbi:Nucleoside-diphosphate-sugar epimerase [Streptomyces sp. DvalAA-14]|uniref:NAD-dependent epimerase/dehydratase family protein n=1 Tax=unclassified Streptomyces TaxID=2593676 RepID=UPI00081BC660|nr:MULTISPECIES: NAD-dependent epimerase/dehydratase family protein [unclassified Streptomyces]MYS24884.1 NAD-dependent epimerase/dehydratase family protein [Streptomyces sp. SID4948]SCE50257.1 Nucleoside-diphosphate-sugar epimerase [Streptomyces sp. DvalAA-14]
MAVFLTGGSGYVGRSVISALVRSGFDVAALARSQSSAAVVTALGAVAVAGDLADTRVLRKAAAAAEGVIHLGAQTGPDAAAVQRAAADAMQEGLGDRGAFVHTGGTWEYGSTDGVVDEDAPLRPPPIAAWLVDNERQVLAAAERGGRPVLLRPGVVYGYTGQLTRMFFTDPGRTGGAVPMIGDGSNHWAMVHVDDLAELYVKALNAAPGSIYVAVNEQNPTHADVVQALAVAAGRPGRVEPLDVAQAVARMGPVAEAFALDQQLTAARARRDLGWTPTHLDALAELAKESAA